MDDKNTQNLVDNYILDDMKKKGLNTAATLFSQETEINQDPVAGLNLSDWWELTENTLEEDNRQGNDIQINSQTQAAAHHAVNRVHPSTINSRIINQAAHAGQNMAHTMRYLLGKSPNQEIKCASKVAPRVKPLIIVLDDEPEIPEPTSIVPQETISSNPDSSSCDRQIGPFKIPKKILRRDIGKSRHTTGQLRLRPKSN